MLGSVGTAMVSEKHLPCGGFVFFLILFIYLFNLILFYLIFLSFFFLPFLFSLSFFFDYLFHRMVMSPGCVVWASRGPKAVLWGAEAVMSSLGV